ncbi:hypothetical protein WME86_03950 [Sorangium sp. So ce1024]
MLLALAFLIAGCGSNDDAPGADPPVRGPTACPPGAAPLDDDRCQPAGLPAGLTAGLPPDLSCPPGEAPLEAGGCQAAGVPPEACGDGFEPDDHGGCEPVLPEDTCPRGQMAIPGDPRCRDVAPCGDGEHGAIPVEANTEFVNAAYAGVDSDGTRARPWKRIQQGIDHAPPGGIVAVAAGIYTEDLVIRSRPVRLWGRCPALVEVVGTGGALATLQILRQRASGSEVHGLAFTGPQLGVLVTGATDVTLEQVWIHDTGSRGLDVEDPYGPASVAVRASLIESARELGVYVGGSEATIEATVVRGTQPRGDGTHGVGIAARHDDTAPQERAKVTLRASVVEQNRDFGVHVIGSEAAIEATVVRATQPSSDDVGGWGLAIVNGAASQERAEVTLRASLLEHNHASSVAVIGSDVVIASTIVRATQPHIDGTEGEGIDVAIDPATEERATLTLRASVLEDNATFGIRVVGSDATIASTVVRDTVPASDGTGGIGLWIQDDRMTNERATLTLRASRIERYISARSDPARACSPRWTLRRARSSAAGTSPSSSSTSARLLHVTAIWCRSPARSLSRSALW